MSKSGSSTVLDSVSCFLHRKRKVGGHSDSQRGTGTCSVFQFFGHLDGRRSTRTCSRRREGASVVSSVDDRNELVVGIQDVVKGMTWEKARKMEEIKFKYPSLSRCLTSR